MVTVVVAIVMAVVAAFILAVTLLGAVFAMAVVITTPARMLMLVAIAHPLLLHKIHGLSAGVVAGAMLAPVFLVPWGHVEVDRLPLHRDGCGHDDDGLRRHQHRLRVVAYVDAPINTRLVDANRNADTGLGQRGAAHGGKGNKGNGSNFFHGGLSK